MIPLFVVFFIGEGKFPVHFLLLASVGMEGVGVLPEIFRDFSEISREISQIPRDFPEIPREISQISREIPEIPGEISEKSRGDLANLGMFPDSAIYLLPF
jgi:hypothetical protein